MDTEVTIDGPEACACWSHDAGEACGWCGTWAPPAGVDTLAAQRARLAVLVSALHAVEPAHVRLASVA